MPPTALLEGYRVVDLSVAAAGPLATAILADQGADVIKVESPAGDFMRTIGTVRNGVSAVFASLNRSKRSICLDLKRPEGVDLLHRLVAGSDVVVHNLRPGVAERLGAGYDELRSLRPDLVYCAITGWGEQGPSIQRPAYDSVVQAASGWAAHQGGMPPGEPQFVRNAVCDKTTGLTVAQLVTAALLARARTGEGRRIGVSMLHAGLAFLWPDGMQTATFLDGDDDGGPRATQPPVHRTADGWISISVILAAEFRALCATLGLDALADDPVFLDNGARSRHAARLWETVDPVLATWPTEQLSRALDAVGVPNAVVRAPSTVHDDPQVVANDLLVEIRDPAAGRMRVPRVVGDLSPEPFALPRPAPALGEHTDNVLAELGLSMAEIAALREGGTVR